MKKIISTLLIVFGLSSLFSANAFADLVRSGYYDKTAEGILVPLRNCSYTVDFRFFGHKQPAYGNTRREIQSYMKKVIIKRLRYSEQDYYNRNRHHEEDSYKYFLQQVPPKGIMQLDYVFTDRVGNLYERSEKIFLPRQGKKFPSKFAIPRECKEGRIGQTIDSIRGRYRGFRDSPRTQRVFKKVRDGFSKSADDFRERFKK